MPKISVIIPCYNHGKYLEEAIMSVKKQTFRDYEIIVVDDGSTDVETIKKLTDLKARFDDVIFINQSNGHLANARNNGVKASRGEFFLPLDADDRIAPRMLERCINFLEGNEELGFVYTHTRFFGDFQAILPRPEYNFYELLRKNYIVASSLIRKKAWQEIGGYDEGMKGGYEDWEFYIRLGKQGWYGKLLRESLFHYRKHGKSMVDEATTKNNLNMNYIQNKHADIYNSKKLQAIKKEWKKRNQYLYRLPSFYVDSIRMGIFVIKRYGLKEFFSRIFRRLKT